MKAALLYYQRFVKDLKSVGFEINPYNPCVANKIVQGKQLAVVWHVDDLKASHVITVIATKMADCPNMMTTPSRLLPHLPPNIC